MVNTVNSGNPSSIIASAYSAYLIHSLYESYTVTGGFNPKTSHPDDIEHTSITMVNIMGSPPVEKCYELVFLVAVYLDYPHRQ